LRLFACACVRICGKEWGETNAPVDLWEQTGHPLCPEAARWAESWSREPDGEGRGYRIPNQATRAALLRDIFGDPWRPVTVDDDDLINWTVGPAYPIARTIYNERHFEDMPVLADALQEAGCQDEDILRHCRGFRRCEVCLGTRKEVWAGAPRSAVLKPRECLCIDGWWLDTTVHVRGCWLLDLLLGQKKFNHGLHG